MRLPAFPTVFLTTLPTVLSLLFIEISGNAVAVADGRYKDQNWVKWDYEVRDRGGRDRAERDQAERDRAKWDRTDRERADRELQQTAFLTALPTVLQKVFFIRPSNRRSNRLVTRPSNRPLLRARDELGGRAGQHGREPGGAGPGGAGPGGAGPGGAGPGEVGPGGSRTGRCRTERS